MDLDSLRDMVNALAGQVRSQQFGGRGRSEGFSRGRSPGSYRGNVSSNAGGPRCFACGGIGHMKRECPTFINRQQGRGGLNRGNNHLKD
jgi:hypothetical protein